MTKGILNFGVELGWQHIRMSAIRTHAGIHYAIQFNYALPDDAWNVELSVARPAPSTWADLPRAVSHLPGDACVIAVIPDEDPTAAPFIHLPAGSEEVIPYDIMRWFMEKVTEEVERCRNNHESDSPL